MKMKFRVLVMAFMVLSILMLSVMSVSAATEVRDEMDMARQSGQSYISKATSSFPDWREATLMNGTAYQNLEGETVAYMFTIQKEAKAIGRIVVGGKSYDYDVFEAGSAPVPQIPDFAELRAAIEKDIDINIDGMAIREPRLVYLGYDFYLAVYDVKGESIAFDLRARRVALLQDFESRLISPQQYKENKAIIPTRYVIEENDLTVPIQGQYDAQVPPAMRSTGCGPASGAMVAEYYKYYWWHYRFYFWPDDFIYLYGSMGTGGMGTMPWNAGPGFVDYAEHYPISYDFGTSWNGISIGSSTYYYNQLKSYIDAAKPFMVLFHAGAPYARYHYCTIRGYRVENNPPRIVIINNPSGQGYKDEFNYETNWSQITLHWLLTGQGEIL